MRPNSRMRDWNAAPTPFAAASRRPRSRSLSWFSAALTETSWPSTVTVIFAIVSSNRRFQALRPVTSFSCSRRSISSDSWCSRQTRRSRSQGRYRARADDAVSFRASAASSSRFSSSAKKTRWLLTPVTFSCAIW